MSLALSQQNLLFIEQKKVKIYDSRHKQKTKKIVKEAFFKYFKKKKSGVVSKFS